MGLAQSFNAVQSNNGKIRVTSEEGVGTTFTLTFPKPIDHSTQNIGGQNQMQINRFQSGAVQIFKGKLDVLHGRMA